MPIISRRVFLQQGSTAAAAATLLSAAPRSLWANPLGQPIGIQLYTVSGALEKDLPGTLDRLHAIGYRLVEAFHYPGYNAKSLRQAVEKAGLDCPSAHLDFNQPNLDSLFREAETLGVRYTVSSELHFRNSQYPKGKPWREMTVDDYKMLAGEMNNIGWKAKQAGFEYAYHNHDMDFRDLGGGQIGYDILLRQSDPSMVNFELDCGWMAVAGYDPAEYLRRYSNRYKMLHIKQFVKNSPRTTTTDGPGKPQGTELGRGKPDYKPIFAAAKVAGVQYYFVEQEPPFLDMTSIEAARADYEYLHKL